MRKTLPRWLCRYLHVLVRTQQTYFLLLVWKLMFISAAIFTQLFTSRRPRVLAPDLQKEALHKLHLCSINVQQQVCLQIVLPPAPCCRRGSLQSLIFNWFSPSSAQCVWSFTCQKTSSIHPSAAEDNTWKRSWCLLINSQFSAGQKRERSDLYARFSWCKSNTKDERRILPPVLFQGWRNQAF